MSDHSNVRVLVVEDEPLLADAIAEWLRDEAHAVDIAHDGTAALDRLTVHDYDVVVHDRNLPGVPGDEVSREVVASTSTARVNGRMLASNPSRPPVTRVCTRWAWSAVTLRSTSSVNGAIVTSW